MKIEYNKKWEVVRSLTKGRGGIKNKNRDKYSYKIKNTFFHPMSGQKKEIRASICNKIPGYSANVLIFMDCYFIKINDLHTGLSLYEILEKIENRIYNYFIEEMKEEAHAIGDGIEHDRL